MTKKDYELIAGIVREGLEQAQQSAGMRQIGERSALWRFADQFAKQARHDNPRFDARRFILACGFQL